MKLDRENQYSGGQALTVTAASTDVVKSGAKIGKGEPMCVLITVEEDAKESDGNETYAAKLQTDDAAAFGSATDVGASVTIPRTAAIGDKFVIDVPPDATMEDWSRVYYTLGGTNPSITVSARLIPRSFLQNEGVFPAGNTIS